jgi:hypothetical protein
MDYLLSALADDLARKSPLLMPEPPFRYHFFVSYTTREDEVQQVLPLVDHVVSVLREAGARVAPYRLPDPQRFPAGDWEVFESPFYLDRLAIGQRLPDPIVWEELARALSAACTMISFISPGYLDSAWCSSEWRFMADQARRRRYPGSRPLSLPIVWKPLGEGGWELARDALEIHRLPTHERTIYPFSIHMFVPPTIELRAAAHPGYYPIEIYDDRVGIERAIRESYSFITSRSRSHWWRKLWW